MLRGLSLGDVSASCKKLLSSMPVGVRKGYPPPGWGLSKGHLVPLILSLGPQGTASSEVNATEEMSTLVNYVEPVKFKSFEAARSEWGRAAAGSWPCPALAAPTSSLHPPTPDRKEQVLRDVVLRGDQGNGATDQESHGVCGVSSPGSGARVGPGGDLQMHLPGVLGGLRCEGSGTAWAAWLGGASRGMRWGPRQRLEEGGHFSPRGPDQQPQIQQAAAQPHLPQGHARGLLQLHAPALLERGLPARGPQLPDPG